MREADSEIAIHGWWPQIRMSENNSHLHTIIADVHQTELGAVLIMMPTTFSSWLTVLEIRIIQ